MSKDSSHSNTAIIRASLRKRYARERRFQWYGRLAVMTGFVFLFILLVDIVGKGTPAFTQQYLKVPIYFDADRLGVTAESSQAQLRGGDYLGVIKSSLRELFPEVSGRKEKRMLYRLVSIGAEYDLRDRVVLIIYLVIVAVTAIMMPNK